MVTGFLIFASNVIGLFVGYYCTMFILHSKASRLRADMKTLYPREFEIWKHGYRRALMDMFE